MNKEHAILHLNFLPIERSKAAERIIHLRELILLGFATFLIFSAMLAIFTASEFFLYYRIATLEDVYQQREQLQRAAQRELSVESITQEKKELKIVQNQIAERFEVDPVIVGVSQAVENTSAVELSTLKIDVQQKEMRISGKANTRDGFLSFIDALREMNGVTEVVYPPGVVFAIEPIVFDVIVTL